MINRKFLTRLLNADYRKSILAKINETKMINLQINAYAKYVSDMQIISRDENLKNDKNACYGFSPITVVCYVDNNDNIVSQFFELKPVNHFLAKEDGNTAVEVVKCLLVEMYLQNKKEIKNFNVDTIDRYLASLENAQAKAAAEEDAKKNSELSSNEQ